MKTKPIESIHNFVVAGMVILVAGLILFTLSIDVTNSRVINRVYLDTTNRFSFEYPSDFTAQPILVADLNVVDVYPTSLENNFNPNVIEIIIANDTDQKPTYNEEIESLKKMAGTGQVLKLSKNDIPAIQAISGSQGERTISSYLKTNGKVIVIRLSQFYYNNTNPLLLNNNSMYTGVYYRILNTLSFF